MYLIEFRHLLSFLLEDDLLQLLIENYQINPVGLR